MREDTGASAKAETGSHPTDQAPAGLGAPRFDPARSEVRTVIVQSKYKGAPLWWWVGKRFASLLYFDPGTFVIGAELLEAGIIIFVGPFMLAFAHIKRQGAAFDKLDAIAMEAGTGATGNTDATAEGGESAGLQGIARKGSQ